MISVIDFEHITFTGGEPFLADGMPELLLACRMKGKRVTLISNGTVGTADTYQLVSRMGVALFELPLLSENEETHDALTGAPGAHRKVIDSINILTSLGAEVCTVFVMTKRNIAHLKATLDLAENLGVGRVMLARFNIGGRGIANATALLPAHGQLKEAFALADRYAAEHRIKISANVCLPRCIINPDEYRHIPVSTCAQHLGRRPVTIDYAGAMRMCNHSPYSVGTIHHTAIASLFQSDYAERWQRARPELCVDCAEWGRCGGGCRAASEQLGNSLYNEDPVIQMLKRDD